MGYRPMKRKGKTANDNVVNMTAGTDVIEIKRSIGRRRYYGSNGLLFGSRI